MSAIQQQRPGAVQPLESTSAADPLEPDEIDLLRLTRALGTLSDNERYALVLRDCRGFSTGEIGRRLGTTEWAVDMLLAGAQRKLAAADRQPTLARRRRVADARLSSVDLAQTTPFAA
jgi:DNA-directed RNA polymerase specialized sigma24 family protein